MIGTLQTKQDQLRNGYFTTGSGKEVILIMGSCRSVPYLNYLKRWNDQNGDRFTINFLDVFNWNWNIDDERVDFDKSLQKLETDGRMITMLKSVNIFLHEFYKNGGMFNTTRNEGKNIYDFGLNPQVDICIPSWNDVFVLFADIIRFDLDVRKKAMQDFNVTGKLSEQLQKEIFEISQRNLNKFYEVCQKSDIPQMENYFKENFLKKRMFYTYNHIAKNFTLAIFKFICNNFIDLKTTPEYVAEISKEDMFKDNYTKLSEYDIKWYGFEWNEPIENLRSHL